MAAWLDTFASGPEAVPRRRRSDFSWLSPVRSPAVAGALGEHAHQYVFEKLGTNNSNVIST